MSVFGDVDVIVAEGVDAELDGWSILGGRATDLAPVPRLAGTPRVAVRGYSVFGDLRLRTLAPGSRPAVGERCSTGSPDDRSRRCLGTR